MAEQCQQHSCPVNTRYWGPSRSLIFFSKNTPCLGAKLTKNSHDRSTRYSGTIDSPVVLVISGKADLFRSDTAIKNVFFHSISNPILIGSGRIAETSDADSINDTRCATDIHIGGNFGETGHGIAEEHAFIFISTPHVDVSTFVLTLDTFSSGRR